ncbi:Uncharacterised protein [Haemophilus parahaemolyticus]|uniref:Uncharacterized protein n=1 Tax=Haemophilus parahaemolyticus TaxID=735 RepID=A0A377I3N6_HAEPH|nr:Uncharacterised protein [Haemophilus parahaemolyticus]
MNLGCSMLNPYAQKACNYNDLHNTWLDFLSLYLLVLVL